MAGYRLNEKFSVQRVERGVSGGGYCCLSRNVADQSYLTEPVTTRHHLYELAGARNGKLAFGYGVVAVAAVPLLDHNGSLRHRERIEIPRYAFKRRSWKSREDGD